MGFATDIMLDEEILIRDALHEEARPQPGRGPSAQRRRVVVTGVGLCSSLGWDEEGVRGSLAAGRTTFRESVHMPGVPVCPITDLGDDAPFAWLSSWRHRRYLSRAAFLSLLAGLRAAADAGFAGSMPPDTDLIGTAAPNLDFERERDLPPGDGEGLDALWLLRWLPNTGNTALARCLGIHGEGLTLGCACASSLQALGEGAARVASGRARRVLVACGDSRLSRGGLLGYAKARVLSANDNPPRASRPFDNARDGFVPGEGGAAFVLEERSAALARGARVRGEILGHGASLDGGSLTAPEASGIYAEEAVRRALDMAGVDAPDWVAAHGTGTVLSDAMEAAMLGRVLGGARPPVTALKSWIGHAASACGALETAILLMAARDGILPGVRNLESPLPAPIRLARARAVGGRVVSDSPALVDGSVGLVENFGFGGQNAALVLRVGDSAI